MARLSVSTLSCDGFAESSYERSIDWLPRLGIEFIELNIWHEPQMTGPFVAGLAKRLSASSLRVSAVHGTGLSGNVEHDVSEKRRLLEIAHRLGARNLVFSGCGGHACPLASHIEVIEALLGRAEELDVTICLENHCDNRFETIEDYIRIFTRIADERVGLCLDTGHFEAADVPVDSVIDELGQRIVHVHIKENGRFGVKDFTRFGEGTTDNLAVVRRLSASGYRGMYNIELSPEIGGSSLGFEDLRHAILMMKESVHRA